jgi:hypothetical protein
LFSILIVLTIVKIHKCEESMLKKSLLSLFVLALTTFSPAFAGQTSPDTKIDSKVAGVWAGSWSGGSSGKFEMTITRETGGKLSATLQATPEQGDGSTFKSKSIETADSKLKIMLEDAEGNVEVLLDGVLEGTSLKGTYSVRDKAQGTEVETGSWSANKK